MFKALSTSSISKRFLALHHCNTGHNLPSPVIAHTCSVAVPFPSSLNFFKILSLSSGLHLAITLGYPHSGSPHAYFSKSLASTAQTSFSGCPCNFLEIRPVLQFLRQFLCYHPSSLLHPLQLHNIFLLPQEHQAE